MGTLITLRIELDAIRSFLKRVINAADAEYSRIGAMSDAGEFTHCDDEANAYFAPMMWEDIAVRAALGELNSLVEWELGLIANGLQSGKKENFRKNRSTSVSDLKIGQIIERIEIHYGIRIEEMSSYGDVKDLRNKVNAFKHRKGFKHPYKDKYKAFPEKVNTSREETYAAIDSVKRFLRDVWSKTKRRECT